MKSLKEQILALEPRNGEAYRYQCGFQDAQEAAAALASAQGEQKPVARLLHWIGPKHMKLTDGVSARTYSEFPVGAVSGEYWKEGAPLYTTAQPADEKLREALVLARLALDECGKQDNRADYELVSRAKKSADAALASTPAPGGAK